MAFPNNIKTSGSLSMNNDLFEYFKGGLMETAPNIIISWYGKENWPIRIASLNGRQFFINSMISSGINENTLLPITRGQLYNYFDNFIAYPNISESEMHFFATTVNFEKLYTFPSIPNTSWTTKMVNDWAKLKCIELALFGDVGNGFNLTDNTLPDFNGMSLKNSVSNWKKSSLAYLRLALINFSSYTPYDGTTYPQRVGATNMTVNTSTRRIEFIYNQNFTEPRFYEYSVNGGDWLPLQTKPYVSPPEGIAVAQFKLRLASDGLYGSSNIISNSTAIPATNFEIVIYVYVEKIDSETLAVSCDGYANYTAPVTVTTSFTIIATTSSTPVLINNQQLVINSGSAAGNMYNEVTFSGGVGNISSYQVSSNYTITPSTVNGLPVQVTFQTG